MRRLILFALVTDSFALSAFSFEASVSEWWPRDVDGVSEAQSREGVANTVGVLRGICRIFLLQLSAGSFQWMFWVVVILALVTVPLAVLLMVKELNDESFVYLMYQLLGSVLLFPICTILVAPLSCTYPNTSTDAGGSGPFFVFRLSGRANRISSMSNACVYTCGCLHLRVSAGACARTRPSCAHALTTQVFRRTRRGSTTRTWTR
jgi:hypothetical protein